MSKNNTGGGCLKVIGGVVVSLFAVISLGSCIGNATSPNSSSSPQTPTQSAPTASYSTEAPPTPVATSLPEPTRVPVQSPTPEPTPEPAPEPVRTQQASTEAEPGDAWDRMPNVEKLKLAWLAFTPDQKEDLRKVWRDYKGTDLEDFILESFMEPLKAEQMPDLTKAEAREFLNWALKN